MPYKKAPRVKKEPRIKKKRPEPYQFTFHTSLEGKRVLDKIFRDYYAEMGIEFEEPQEIEEPLEDPEWIQELKNLPDIVSEDVVPGKGIWEQYIENTHQDEQ